MLFPDIHTHSFSVDDKYTIASVDALSLPMDDKFVHVSVGIHPWFLSEENASTQLEALAQVLNGNRIVAIGEGGLDKLKGPSLALQKEVFRQEVALSETYHLPMVIHCVRAFNELIQLKKEWKPQQPWIIHGFRGKETVAKELLRHGCWISFGESFQENALLSVPIDRLFIETDESKECIENIYERIASIRGMTLEELTKAITVNVENVFFKA